MRLFGVGFLHLLVFRARLRISLEKQQIIAFRDFVSVQVIAIWIIFNVIYANKLTNQFIYIGKTRMLKSMN